MSECVVMEVKNKDTEKRWKDSLVLKNIPHDERIIKMEPKHSTKPKIVTTVSNSQTPPNKYGNIDVFETTYALGKKGYEITKIRVYMENVRTPRGYGAEIIVIDEDAHL